MILPEFANEYTGAYAETDKAAGDVPFLVKFTFGEYGFEADGNNTCGGLMLSYSAFGKSFFISGK